MSKIQWQHDLPPVYLDFETQSAADLKAVGGRKYAADPSTRVLSLVVLIDDVVITWVPSGLFTKQVHAKVFHDEWPQGHVLRDRITYCCPDLPQLIREAADAGRLFVGHNVLGFDRFIWREKVGGNEPLWADTLLLARTGALPGELGALATEEVGQGKDEAKRLLKRLMKPGEIEVGTLAAVLRYNIADVLLLEKLWAAFAELPVEADVIQVHDTINERGIAVDVPLLRKLANVAVESVCRAGDEIATLTDGAITLNNIRSVQQVHKWLNSHGIFIRDYDGKASLRKNIVEQAIANPWSMLDEDAPVSAAKNIPPEVFDVLRLRGAALRITEAKAEKAISRVSPDGRIRDLFGYHMAHTGRWSSQGVQVHNLPRPRKGIDVGQLIRLHETDQWGDDGRAGFDLIRSVTPSKLTVDDALSALIRPSFLPRPGYVFVISDFSTIEPRGTAWCADQTDLLDTFASGRDVYCEFGTKMFGRTITKDDDLERQVSKICIIALGYSMGAEKFRLFCGLVGIDLTAVGLTAEQCVELYRGTYRQICGTQYSGSIQGMTYRRGGLWDKLNAAMFDIAAGRSIRVDVGKCCFTMATDGAMVLTLPSGRQIRYRNIRIEDRIPKYAKTKGIDRAKATLIYDGPRSEGYLYGGRATENIVQAISRDLLATAIVQVEAAGIAVVAHVHDEIVCEVPEAEAETALDTVLRIMTDPPSWAAGFPIAVEGFTAPRYFKSPPPGYLKKSAKSA